MVLIIHNIRGVMQKKNQFRTVLIKSKMMMVSFLTNQNLTIFTASFTISGQYVT